MFASVFIAKEDKLAYFWATRILIATVLIDFKDVQRLHDLSSKNNFRVQDKKIVFLRPFSKNHEALCLVSSLSSHLRDSKG